MDKKSNKYIPQKITASLSGKMVKLVPTRNGIEIYLQPTWLMLLSVWVFGGAVFTLSTFWPNTIFMISATLLGGLGGFIFTYKMARGKLKYSFLYKDIVCLIPAAPYFTIVHDDQKMFELRMLDKPQRRLLAAIEEATSVGLYDFGEKHTRYYFTARESGENSENETV